MHKKELTFEEFRDKLNGREKHTQFGLIIYIASCSEKIAISNRYPEEIVYFFTRFGLIRWQEKKGFIEGQYHIVQLLWEDYDGGSC